VRNSVSCAASERLRHPNSKRSFEKWVPKREFRDEVSLGAWLTWGMKDGSGARWEKACRHKLKADLYGNPPRQVAEKAAVYANQLVTRMQTCNDWPHSLRFFVKQVQDAITHLSGRKVP
jgi:hypothetical protein